MNRPIALLAALILAAISVSSACIASPGRSMAFTLQAYPNRSDVHFTLRRGDTPNHGNMSSSFATADLAGLDVAALKLPGQHPLRFAYVHDAGRIDCSGYGGSSVATGQCTFTPNSAFSDFLAAHGIGRPSFEDAYDLTMTGASRDLVEALEQNRYPKPNIEKLTELAAVGVDRSYIAGLAARGFIPKTLDELTEFAALDVTPEYVDALARSGYRKLTGEEITELKAVGVDPAFIATLASAGYRKLSVDELEQMAALDIDPAFINGFGRIGYANLPVDTLVQLKALDVTPDYVRALQVHGLSPRSADQLVKLKAAGLGDKER
jgi:hypothetical protein